MSPKEKDETILNEPTNHLKSAITPLKTNMVNQKQHGVLE